VPDGLFELSGRAMRAAPDVGLSQRCEPALDLIGQDAEVGVKWTWNRGLRANQALIAGVLWVP